MASKVSIAFPLSLALLFLLVIFELLPFGAFTILLGFFRYLWALKLRLIVFVRYRLSCILIFVASILSRTRVTTADASVLFIIKISSHHCFVNLLITSNLF
jgi:hypothetical protein